ncbi:hypothetical protein PCASD_21237 [Puccinia coronata f. sp. avenae]|uniref:Fatty acid desaturase domain-containing protein n=1 Tax=Puccinia coronata f. sp. avenae TaxID=200324 RepID=A0A2N5SDA1_9BASI|nr:hypothetical protein PCASD_21650 [Puccinia coronata f. sp. avenae]PLW27073.1 hypothetical protein PCASD_21237 [Puccinia coronata f. sp. avenae]
MMSNSISVSNPATAHESRQRQRKKPMYSYDPNSDLSESEGSSDPKCQSGNTCDDNERTDVDHDIYIQRTLRQERPLPPITWRNFYREINVVSTLALTIIPLITIYGAFTTPLCRLTLAWSIIYYYFTGLSITAGYHRLWSHRSYNASLPLQYFFALGGSGAVQGSIQWWARGHRAYHRYTDTDLDPYSAHKGLL